GNSHSNRPFVSKAHKSVISARPSLMTKPTGRCINALADKIQKAESTVPIATSQIQTKCKPLDRRSQPNTHIPIKVDSKKKESKASMASGAPKISPTNRENSDQFIPN